MDITRVERLRSGRARYRITFDEGDPITISEDLLIRFGLASGDDITSSRLNEIVESSERDSAKHSAYHYISYRPRSEREVHQHLRRKGFTKERAEQTVREFVRLRLIDDEEFAAMVVRDTVARGRTGPAGVRRKLMEKGIARARIDELIAEHFPDERMKQQAIELLRKRVSRTRSRLETLDPARRRARLYQYLCQRGFSSAIAAQAIKSIEE